MRKSLLIGLFIILSLTGVIRGVENPSGLTLDTVQIKSVSTRLNDLSSTYRTGSIYGGTTIYITATGLDQTPSNNVIMVGPYECLNSQMGVGGIYISCETTPAWDANRRRDLLITIAVNRKNPSTCSTGRCTYSYTDDTTPFMKSIFQSTTTPSKTLALYGFWRLSSTSQISKIRISNDYLCDIFLDSLNPDDDLDVSSYQSVYCTVSDNIPAGLYNLTMKTQIGNPHNHYHSYQITSDGSDSYQVMILPEVSSVSSNSGSSQGQILTITGKGFGSSLDDVSVKIGENNKAGAGLTCEPESVSNNEIKCRVQAGLVDTSDSAYTAGYGSRFTRYQFTSDNPYGGAWNFKDRLLQNIDYFNINTQYVNEVEEGYLGSLEKYIYNTNEGYHVRGWFKAPRTGAYNFQLSGDDQVLLYLNPIAGDSDRSHLVSIATLCAYKSFRNYFFPWNSCDRLSNIRSADQNLVAGKLYYYELFAWNSASEGHFTVSVETPQETATIWKNSRYETQGVLIQPQTQLETYQIKVWNYTGQFSFQFTYNDPKWERTTEKKTYTQYTASYAASQIDWATNYMGTTVSIANLDASGNVIASNDTTTTVAGRQWTVAFTSNRFDWYKNMAPKLSGVPVSNYRITKVQEGSTQVSGQFSVLFNGSYVFEGAHGSNNTKISYERSGWDLQWYFRRTFQQFDFEANNYRRAYDGRNFSISFIGYRGDIDGVLQTENYLKGGLNDRPDLSSWVIQNGSTRPLFEPVPADMLRIQSPTPQVVVSVKGIQSQPTQSNLDLAGTRYETDTSKDVNLTAYTYSAGTLSLTHTTSSLINSSSVEVWFAENKCTGVSITSATTFTCTVSQLVGGNSDLKPIVNIKGFGFLGTSGVSAQTGVDLVLSSLSLTEGSVNGGIEVTITGQNFPLSLEQANSLGLEVWVGTVQSEKIVSVSNTQIVFILPGSEDQAEGQVDVSLVLAAFEAVSNSLAFTYSSNGVHRITSISPTSASPVEKGELTITGTGFGTDKSKVTVYLDVEYALNNSFIRTPKYQLNVLDVSDTQIRATLSGGVVGVFFVRVFLEGVGNNLNSSVEFQYLIEITNIQPTSGSVKGGQILTITGRHFSSSSSDNAAYIQYETTDTYLGCAIISSTKTEIKCKVPPKTSGVQGVATVAVEGKLMEEAVCSVQGGCLYTYDPSLTGSLVDEGKTLQYKNGASVTVNGTLFQGVISLEVTSLNTTFTKTYQPADISLSVVSSTQFTYQIPVDLPQGTYVFLFNQEQNGYLGGIYAEILFDINQFSQAQNISQGGEDLTVTGSGFNSSQISVTVDGKAAYIRSITPTEIKFRAPANAKNGTVSIAVSQNSVSKVCLNCLNIHRTYSIVISALGSQTYSTPASVNVTYTTTNSTSNFGGSIWAYLENTFDQTQFYNGTISTSTKSVLFTDIPSGIYTLFIRTTNGGYALITNSTIDVALNNVAIATTESSFAGGKLTVTGQLLNPKQTYIEVCGFSCPIRLDESTTSSLVCDLPQVRTQNIVDLLGISKKPQLLTGQYTSDTKLLKVQNSPYVNFNLERFFGANANSYSKLYDGKITTYYTSNASNTACSFGYDFGPLINVQLTKLQFDIRVDKKMTDYLGLKLQGSTDNSSWTDLFEVTYSTTNFWVANHGDLDTASLPKFRYLRIYNNQTFNCEIAEFAIYGYKSYNEEISALSDNLSCPVHVFSNGKYANLTNQVVYKESKTAIVEDISPNYGWLQGNEVVTLTGTNFGTDSSQVTITLDGIVCAVQTISDTEIKCLTGDKSSSSSTLSNVVEVIVAQNPAVIQEGVDFYYGLYWSNDLTWGGDAPPRNGDLVYVPAGQTLIIDESTVDRISTFIVEGILVFADNQALIEVHAEHILIREGKFIAGSPAKPYQNKLVITLYGKIEDSQLPVFGNKVVGCHNCQFQLHGKPVNPVWTFLAETVEVGAQTLTTLVTVDWKVGDEIVIASTDFNHYHAEQVKITNIASDKKTITFTPALAYQHVSGTDTYDNFTVPIRAEIGLLSRQIVIQGDPSDSLADEYGAHLMFHGRSSEGLNVNLQYTEFRNSGQPKIIGRYAIHFHMVGEQSDSIVQGNAVHDSNARIITIHATHYLKVINNVGYKCVGHNIFLEDGIETHNRIERNLVVSTRRGESMLQTDLTSASIWVTHPTNYVIGNHVAGSDFYGIWYEVHENPDGPSARSDICPQGMPLGEFRDNVAHSNVRFGLRFFHLYPRQRPCDPIRTDTDADPWQSNPSIQQVYDNFTSWRNGESGVLAEFVGNAIFKNFRLLDNVRSGFQSHKTNFTKEPVIFRDSLVVLHSNLNGEIVTDIADDLKRCGILLPRTDGFLAENITIYNVIEDMYQVESSSENQFLKLWTQGGKQANLKNIQCKNCSSGKTLQWRGGPFVNLVWDIDGSLTGTGVSTYVTPYYAHFDQVIADGKCVKDTTNFNIDSVVCSVPLRMVQLRNFNKLADFQSLDMRIFNLQSETQNFSNIDQYEQNFGVLPQYLIKEKPLKDGLFTYVGIYAVGYSYNVHFFTGVDWSNMLVVPSLHLDADDAPIVLRFNHTQNRELFESKRMIGGVLNVSYYQSSGALVDNDTQAIIDDDCQFGEWDRDVERNFYYLCISGKGRVTQFDSIQIAAIYCRDTCPRSGMTCPITQTSKFSQTLHNCKKKNETVYEWRQPVSGDDVLINCSYAITFDLESFVFGTLIIDGTLRIDKASNPYSNITITATNIWVRSGSFYIGTDSDPFTTNVNIVLKGNRTTTQLVIDDFADTGSKTFAVTGRVEFYGVPITNQWTRLTAQAAIGASLISVGTTSGWKAGDKLVIGATEFNSTGTEEVEILSVVNSTTLQLKSPLQYFHYGSPKPTASTGSDGLKNIGSSYSGGIDMRAGVGLLNRNIKISGSYEDSWGGQFLIYHWYVEEQYETIDLRGSVYLSGVEFDYMGQQNSQRAALSVKYTNREVDDPADDIQSVVTLSSIHNSQGIAVNGIQSANILLQNNVIQKAERFLVQSLEKPNRWIVKSNFLVQVTKRNSPDIDVTHLWDPVGAIYMWEPFIPGTGNDVSSNVIQGSEGIGAAISGVPCSSKDSFQFKDNTYGSIDLVGVLMHSRGQDECQWSGDMAIYHAQKGIIQSAKAVNNQGFMVEFVRVAETQGSLILRHGSLNSRINNAWIQNNFVSALLRTDCPQCFTLDPRSCNSGWGMQLALSSITGESFPFLKSPLGYDVLCVPTSTHQSAFIRNNVFHNFRSNYPTGFEPCNNANNIALRNHGSASDATAAHYLTNTTCDNCEANNLIYIEDPKPQWQGWFGGCGDFNCTGLRNVLVQDTDGSFFGAPVSTISMNTLVADAVGMRSVCTSNPTSNTFRCNTLDFQSFEFEGISPDRRKLQSAPVYVDNGVWRNKLNLWREWEWQGPEPLNLRQNSFQTLIQVNQSYVIEYSGSRPVSMIHRLGQRTEEGEPNNWIKVRYNYDTPLSIQVAVSRNDSHEQIINSFPILMNISLDDHLTECGANNYHYDNRTVFFVVTGEIDCSVIVRLINSVRISLRVTMTPDEFVQQDVQSTFIDRIATFLGVTTDRIRIVGLKTSRRMRNLQTSDTSTIQFEILAPQPVGGTAITGTYSSNEASSGSAVNTSSSNTTTASNSLDSFTYQASVDFLSLQNLSTIFVSGINTSSLDLGLPATASPQVEDVQILVVKNTTSGDVFTEDDLNPDDGDSDVSVVETKSGQIGIIIGVILGSILLIGIGFVYFKYYQKAQLRNKMLQIKATDQSKLPADNQNPEQLEIESQKSKSQINQNLPYDERSQSSNLNKTQQQQDGEQLRIINN